MPAEELQEWVVEREKKKEEEDMVGEAQSPKGRRVPWICGGLLSRGGSIATIWTRSLYHIILFERARMSF